MFSSYFNSRELRITYSPDGKLRDFALLREVNEMYNIPGFDDEDGMLPVDSLGIYVNEKKGVWHAQSDYDDMQQEVIEEDKVLKLKNYQDGKELDDIVVPLDFNPEELLEKWLSNLKNNLTMADLRYDEAWRGKDFVYEAGIRWDTNETLPISNPEMNDL